jgi:hypothetical protein
MLALVVALLSVTVTVSQALSHTRREARQGTRFFSSQASSWSRGYKTALPILTNVGPTLIARQFLSVPTVTSPR